MMFASQASGVVCSRRRPDGSDGGRFPMVSEELPTAFEQKWLSLVAFAQGCNKGVCFPCMLRASSMMFGKVVALVLCEI